MVLDSKKQVATMMWIRNNVVSLANKQLCGGPQFVMSITK